jgi:hypothetical protein
LFAERVHASSGEQGVSTISPRNRHAPRVFAAKATTLSGLGEADCTARRSSCRLPLAVQHRRRQDLGRRVGDAAGEDDRHGLPVGTTVQFRCRSVIKGGASDWSAPLSMVVS